MTVLEAGNLLFKWYSEHDCYEMERDFIKVISITDTKEEDQCALYCALENLEKIELVQSREVDSKKWWILSKPFTQHEQNLVVSANVALQMGTLINTFCDTIDNPKELCDVTNVTERDIGNLLFIASYSAGQATGATGAAEPEESSGFGVEK